MKGEYPMYSLEIKENEMKPGRICLGFVKVEMDRIFLFGSKQPLSEMVSFKPGMGNGSYEVYAEIKDVPGHGFRVTKVEIECISEDEIMYLAKQQSDHVMEVSY